jgi:predicted glycosyltransferase involved in capsule biosynthesis
MGEYQYFNSIITTHKGRLGSVRSFLRALLLSSKKVDKNSFEIVIANLDTDVKVDNVIDGYKDKLNIKHCKIAYDGLFWKSKALNHCALNTNGKYITMLDIDAIVSSSFLEYVESFYKDPVHEKVKLAYRVRFLDPKASRIATKTEFNEIFLNDLARQHKKFRQAFERYTKDEIRLRNMNNTQKKWLENHALGNSHYTMRKEDFMAIGGYDERFVGWACEDLDFNRRAFIYLGGGHLVETVAMTIFSVHHERTSWMNGKNTKKNEHLYKENKDNKVVQLSINENWGKF